MSKKIGVSKIVIQIGDKEAELTIEQARELKEALNALLGERVVERVVERDNWYPYYPYPYTSPRYWSVTVGDTPAHGITTGEYTTGTYTLSLNQ